MAILSKECLEKLKNKIDLIDFLSTYLEIKKMGAYYKARCPFHEEKTPSFMVQPGASTYHCFGCSAHGDAITFLMQHERLSFMEAVEHLANRYQVLLEFDESQGKVEGKKRAFDLLSCATQFFHQMLIDSKEGDLALEYLKTRSINLEFIKRFQLGLAPKNGALFTKHLHKSGFKHDELDKLGLVNQYGSCFFYERIIFPIHNATGSVVGFSARSYLKNITGGKYINSKESYIFKKSHLLFGLHESRQRIAKKKRVLIVEGQIDALRLIDKGLNATVAPLGTALTEFHVDKLKQLGVEEAYLAFDSDEAGLNAMVKSGHLLQKKSITTYIVPMPAKEDPDSFIIKNGIKAFSHRLQKKIDYLNFLVRISSKKMDLQDPANKARLVKRLSDRIQEWEDSVMVYESLKKVAHLLELPEKALGLGNVYSPQITMASSQNLKQKPALLPSFLETDALTWLIHPSPKRERFLSMALNHLDKTYFLDERCKAIFEMLQKKIDASNSHDTLSQLIDCPNEATRLLVGELFDRKIKEEESEELFASALQRLLDRKWMRDCEVIKQKIESEALSDDETISLAKEFDALKKNRPLVKENT